MNVRKSRQPSGWSPDQPDLFDVWDEQRLVRATIHLGAHAVASLSDAEASLCKNTEGTGTSDAQTLREAINAHRDPLGEIFSVVRSSATRRSLGATYTPLAIVRSMIAWAKKHGEPARVIDPGVGSARFLVEAGRVFPNAQLVGIDVDPLAALMARAHLSAAGMAARSEIALADFCDFAVPEIEGRTLFIGNPPYIRHHLLSGRAKDWLVSESAKIGLKASQLAGLHVYFFLKTAIHANKGDYGTFITAAEWLDVNYGSLVRDLFLHQLGGERITVIEPTAMPFPDAASTAAVTLFKVGEKPKEILLSRVETLSGLGLDPGGRVVRRERLEIEKRWSHMTRTTVKPPADFIELGELCRVHRGAVTGANRVWIAGEHSRDLPANLLYPSITRAKELIAAGPVLDDLSDLKSVIDIPEDLDSLDAETKRRVEKFLRVARRLGADQGYVANNRKAWWSVGLKTPAPILATYMARRPPAFVRNSADARHINIAHGLYPRESLSEELLRALANYLSTSTDIAGGRTYAGGLTKFEPREMERIVIPRPEVLLGA